MLKMTKTDFELIQDPDIYIYIYIFYEKSTTGGLSYISNKYRKANNKYLKSYDSKKMNILHT